MMRSIMNVFGSDARHAQTPQPGATPAQASAMANAGLSPATGNNTVPGPGSIPLSDGSVPAIPATATGPASPLENYKDLFKVDPVKDWKRPDPTVKLDADPTKTLAAARQVDYMKSLDPALLVKATSGDSGAMLEALQSVAQTVTAHNTTVTAAIVESAISELNKKYEMEIIPSVLRRNQVQQTVRADNSLYDNPAMSDMLTTVETRLMNKYPQESPEQIRERAKDYLDGFTRTVADHRGWTINDKPQPAASASRETDWDAWVGG